MPGRVSCFLVLFVVAWLSAGPLSRAQVTAPATPAPSMAPGNSAPPAGPPAAADVSPPAVQAVKPETYYLRDQDGRLVPVLNMPYEEFRRLQQLDVKPNPAGVELPAYALQELTITGTATATRADLKVTVTLRLQHSGWVRVPLLMQDSILREPPAHEGGGEFFLTCDQDGGGYDCWIRGPQEPIHRVSLQLTTPVREVGNELRLALQPPRAASSELDLRVPIPDAVATVSDGSLTVNKEGGETRFLVNGVAGDFQLAWTKAAAAPVETRPVLRADAKTTIRVEGVRVREVSGDVRLTVTSLRGGIDSFGVRLPPGTQLYPTQPSQTGYRLTEVAGAEESQGTLVQVKLDRPQTEPVTVQLLTELTPVGNGKTPEFEAGGIEVEGAVRQATVIDLVVNEDLSVTAKPGPNVQRTTVPEESRHAVASRYESFRRSHSLRIQVAAQETQVGVDPFYLLQVKPNRVRLTATLKYKVRGRSASTVSVQLANWRVEQVGPDSLVDADTLDREKREPLQIPLKTAAVPDSGEFTLQLDAIQEIIEGSGAVSITLPRPEAKAATRPVVAVLPADNVELTIADTDLQGLEKEPFPPQVELPRRQQSPLFFRERSDVKSAVLGAALRLRERAVSVASHASLKVAGPRLQVQQDLDIRVAYEPLRTLDLLVSRALLDSGGLKIMEGSQALPFSEVTSSEAAGGAEAPPQKAPPTDRPVHVQVDLLAERIGQIDVLLQYELPTPAPGLTGTSLMQVPFVVPASGADTVVTTSRLEIDAGEDAQVQLQSGGWERDGAAEPAEAREVYLSRAFPPDVELLITRLDRRRRTSTAVQQAWIQSWLGSSQQRDRAVFRVLTNEDRLELRPVGGARIESVILDSQLVLQHGKSETGPVAVVLPRVAEPQEHVVEIWQTSSRRQPGWGAVVLQAPAIHGASVTKRFYWQLALSPNERLLFSPAAMTLEMQWQRRGLFLERFGSLDQAQLEQWIGASRQEPLPASVPRYLFSGFGDIAAIKVAVAPRWAIVLVFSGVTLSCGWLLIYVPRLRHPAVLFFLGVAVLAATAAAPDLAAVVAQASLLGLLLTLFALALKSIVDWHQSRQTVVRGVRRPSPESKTARAAVSASKLEGLALPSTTATVGAEVPLGESAP